ncbi:MAG: permease-like cell division protein FtsX [Nitrospirae bacterium]|nr:permease-like cell division protein FtsX [Nitrospirota bacterium]MDA1303957.1 permease-like cell division protein FtsX [Nitrospirota bacterium]
MRRPLYLIQEAFVNIRINRTSVMIGIITTAFTISCFGLFALLYGNLKNLAGTLQQDIEVLVYVQPEASDKIVEGIRQRLEGEKAVNVLSFVSKAEALKEFHQQFPDESTLLQGMEENPLPASFVVQISPQFQESDSIEAFAERIKQFPGVEQVRYSQDWIDTLALLVSYFEFGAIVIGLILAVATITIIANTVRLSFYLRKEEIEILRLIGATGSFIATPYVIEGALLGACGGALALVLLKGVFEFFLLEINASGWFSGLESVLIFFPFQTSLFLVLSGMLLGCGSSIISVFGLMRVRNEAT